MSVAVALVAVFYARAPCVHAAGTYVHAAVETPVFVLHGFTAHLPFRRTVEYRRHHYVCRTDLDSRAFLQRYAAALYLRLSVAPYLQVFHFYVARQQLADDRVLETQRPARAEVELAVRPAYRQFLHRQCEEVETVEEPQREAFGFRGGYVELPVPKYVDGYVYHAAVAFPDKVIGQGQMSPDVALGYRVLKERHAEAVQRKLPVPERAAQQGAVVSFFLCLQSNRPRYAARAYQHVSAHYLGGGVVSDSPSVGKAYFRFAYIHTYKIRRIARGGRFRYVLAAAEVYLRIVKRQRKTRVGNLRLCETEIRLLGEVQSRLAVETQASRRETQLAGFSFYYFAVLVYRLQPLPRKLQRQG